MEKTEKIYNFSAAPSMLPDEVRAALSEAILNYKGSGRSVTEIGLYTQEYSEILTSAESSLRRLLSIPQGFRVLFLSGGSEMQYSAIPLNFLSDRKYADYVLTGRLSKLASQEAKKYAETVVSLTVNGKNVYSYKYDAEAGIIDVYVNMENVNDELTFTIYTDGVAAVTVKTSIKGYTEAVMGAGAAELAVAQLAQACANMVAA